MSSEHSENFFIELLKFALIAISIVGIIRLFIAQPFVVSGESMVPTFQNREYLIVDELTYRIQEPKRGDVIVFRYPKNPSDFFIKRIIGLPGETVHIADEGISVTHPNGTKVELQDSFVTHQGNGGTREYVVPPKEYFVMGDNRPESFDSRSWGYLPRKNIVGRALVRLLPLSTISLFPGSTIEPQ